MDEYRKVMILLDLKAGDKERLNLIKRILEQGKKIDHSDMQYLEKTVQDYLENQDNRLLPQSNSDRENSVGINDALGSLNERTINIDIWNALEQRLVVRQNRIKILGISLLSASALLIVVWPPWMAFVIIANAALLGFILSPVVLAVKIQAVFIADSTEKLSSLQDLGIFIGIFTIVWIFVPLIYRLTRALPERRNLYFYLAVTQIGNMGIFIYQHVTPVGFLWT